MRRNRTPFRRFLPMDTDVASMIQIVAIIIALVIVMVSIVFLVWGTYRTIRSKTNTNQKKNQK